MINGKKIGLLHVAKAQLGLEEPDYRQLLEAAAGVTSASELSDAGFTLVMRELERLGFRSSRSRRGYGNRPGFASPAQVATIRKLWADYHGEDPDEAALNTWLERFHHVSAVRFITAEKAGAVLVALKAMVGRKQKAR